jgi:fumarate reductase flavoprotein subunit
VEWSAETDVLVVGGGGGGLVAALAARASGASVIVVEKSERLGGNTVLSSGSVPGAGTRFQREAGIDDSPQLMIADVMTRTNGTAPRHLVELLAHESAPLVEWLVDDVGAPLALVADLKNVGHSVPRTHAPPGRDAQLLFDALERAALERDILLSTGIVGKRLIVDDHGEVIGAAVQSRGQGAEDTVRARKVILAANGFGANREMLRQFCPEIANAPYFGHLDNTGDAIRWGMELGARVCNMAAYQGHASVSYPHGNLLSWTVMERGGFLVNAAGERFVDENLGYSGCASAVLAQPERCAFAIFDARIRDYMMSIPEFASLAEAGGVKSADDVRQCAAAFGIAGETVAATLEAYNAAAATGADPLGRRQFGAAPLVAPFSIVRVTAGLFHTQGGLEVDRHAQPVRADGTPIANLYAVGGSAVGISGADGGRGYVSANGLLCALGLGRVAGRHATQAL